MRISSTGSATELKRQVAILQSQQQKSFQRIGTGRKINTPTDNPALASKVIQLQTENNEIVQYRKNAEDADVWTNITSDKIQSLNNIMQTVQENILKCNDPNCNDSIRQNYANEINQMLEHALGVANSKHLGKYLMSGTKYRTKPFEPNIDQGKITAIDYNGSDSSIPGNKVYIDTSTTVVPGTEGAENEKIRDILNNIIAARDALETTPPDQVLIETTRNQVIDDGDSLASMLGKLGAKLRRINDVTEQNGETIHDNIEYIVNSTGIDFPQAFAEFKKSATAYDATMAVNAKLLNTSLLDYLR